MTDNPYQPPSTYSEEMTPNSGSAAAWQSVIQPFVEVAGWTRFLGLTLTIIGVIYCLTIVGAIVGWVPLWIGILLMKAGDQIKSRSAETSREGVANISKAIRIAAIAALVFLIFMGLYLVLIMIALVVGFVSQASAAMLWLN